MSTGFHTTFEVLSSTLNDAAIAVLLPALDSPYEFVQDQALRAVLSRRSPAAHRAVLARLHTDGTRWRETLTEFRGRLTTTLRDAILGQDLQMGANGCEAVSWFHEYDLVPALINVAEDRAHGNADRAAITLLELAEQLYQELAGPRDYRNRRDPQLVRQHVNSSLERSVRRFAQHKRLEIVEAFLQLVNRDNATLKQILKDPHHGSYLVLVESLTASPRSGIVRLLLSYLDDTHAPSAAIQVLAHRCDAMFLTHLLKKIGNQPSAAAANNLRRINDIAWLREAPARLDALGDEAQHGVVQMVVASGMRRLDVFEVLRYLARHGKAGGRRAAVAALAEFNGAEANGLIALALEDPDARVQARALSQLRRRGMPDALSRLINALDSPVNIVRETARNCLSEFSIDRFLSVFDVLSDPVRRSTGALVKKIDLGTVSRLASEMAVPVRTRRLRAIEIAALLNLVPRLAEQLIELLSDTDHMVRVNAATALGAHESPLVRLALADARHDRSIAVQEAAAASLERLDWADQQAEAYSEPAIDVEYLG